MRIVLTSVQYGDFLAVTLPAWKAVIPAGALLVATAPTDRLSQDVASAHDVPVVVTDAWTRADPTCHAGGEPTFNMALGLDVAMGVVEDRMPPVADGELCGHVNPDCYPFGRWPADASFARDVVYGFWRHECLTAKTLDQHRRGVKRLAAFPRLKNSHGWPIGYCQIFRAQAGRRFGSYPTAGKFDTNFSARFASQEMRTEMYLLHLGPINVRENWGGRVVPHWGAA